MVQRDTLPKRQKTIEAVDEVHFQRPKGVERTKRIPRKI